jgi:phage gp46-like protein|tara:strand:- start:2592 stop:2723 length:132 start_codon:yes stop_codon:yes gene_type:complete
MSKISINSFKIISEIYVFLLTPRDEGEVGWWARGVKQDITAAR